MSAQISRWRQRATRVADFASQTHFFGFIARGRAPIKLGAIIYDNAKVHVIRSSEANSAITGSLVFSKVERHQTPALRSHCSTKAQQQYMKQGTIWQKLYENVHNHSTHVVSDLSLILICSTREFQNVYVDLVSDMYELRNIEED